MHCRLRRRRWSPIVELQWVVAAAASVLIQAPLLCKRVGREEIDWTFGAWLLIGDFHRLVYTRMMIFLARHRYRHTDHDTLLRRIINAVVLSQTILNKAMTMWCTSCGMRNIILSEIECEKRRSGSERKCNRKSLLVEAKIQHGCAYLWMVKRYFDILYCIGDVFCMF